MAEQMMQPGQEQQPQGGGDDIGMLVDTVGQGLTILSELVGKTPGVDPAIPQAFSSLAEQFAGLIEQMGGGAQQPQQGTTSPEQGANPNARPV
jgi:hypothetical protein